MPHRGEPFPLPGGDRGAGKSLRRPVPSDWPRLGRSPGAKHVIGAALEFERDRFDGDPYVPSFQELPASVHMGRRRAVQADHRKHPHFDSNAREF
ncbi:MAG: hypothetical protein F4Y06_01480 [Rhodospirillales bacterium]|nr:hypothetical protein [Rhodospirillales bacterium]